MGFQAQRPPRSMTVLAFLMAPMARSLGNCTLGTGKCPAILTVAGMQDGADSPIWGGHQALPERRSKSFGAESRKNSTRTTKAAAKRKVC